MNKEIKRQWIDALRSGRYSQGFDVLRESEKHFCANGVLCDISGLGEWRKGTAPHDSKVELWVYSAGEHTTEVTPPIPVLTWAELDPDVSTYIETLNDERMTFDYIADYIEQYL